MAAVVAGPDRAVLQLAECVRLGVGAEQARLYLVTAPGRLSPSPATEDSLAGRCAASAAVVRAGAELCYPLCSDGGQVEAVLELVTTQDRIFGEREIEVDSSAMLQSIHWAFISRL